MSFYLTLPSHKTTAYPDNTTNHFQVQLPRQIPLDVDGSEQWQVAMSAISVPDVTPIVSRMVTFKSQNLFVMSWQSEIIGTSTLRRNAVFFPREILDRAAPKNGVELCKTIVSFCTNSRLFLDLKDQHFLNRKFERNGKVMYPDIKMDGDDLLLDYSKAELQSYFSYLHFDEGFAAAMKWVDYLEDGTVTLGPNIQIITNTSLDLDKTPAIAADVTRAGTNVGAYWTVDNGWLKLSKAASWRFVNVNQAYEKMTNYSSRSLFVYCNVGESQVVGNKITDVLREIPYQTRGGGHQYIEPKHLQYKPVRTNVLDIIEVQVAETDGKLTKFEDGTTTVTLHVKKTV